MWIVINGLSSLNSQVKVSTQIFLIFLKINTIPFFNFRITLNSSWKWKKRNSKCIYMALKSITLTPPPFSGRGVGNIDKNPSFTLKLVFLIWLSRKNQLKKLNSLCNYCIWQTFHWWIHVCTNVRKLSNWQC